MSRLAAWWRRRSRRGKAITVVAVLVLLAAIGGSSKSPSVAPGLVAGQPTSSPRPAVVTTAPSEEPFVADVSPTGPTPTPKPTVKPKATLRPAALTFGKLSYTAAGCWSSDYRDAEGHSISGAMVDFKVTAKNTGQVKSELVPIRIETTDWFETTPLLFKSSWDGARYSNEDKSILIVGPAVLPGKSRAISWSVLLQTPFDVHYTVDVGDSHWEPWTSVEVCY